MLFDWFLTYNSVQSNLVKSAKQIYDRKRSRFESGSLQHDTISQPNIKQSKLSSRELQYELKKTTISYICSLYILFQLIIIHDSASNKFI